MNKLFIGREKEQRQLKEYLSSDQSEFIAVYMDEGVLARHSSFNK